MSTPLPEIRSPIRRHAGAGKIASAQTRIPGLRVTAARVMTEPVNQVYEPMFGLVAQGTKSILLADKAFHYGAGQYLVVSVDLPRHKPHYRCKRRRSIPIYRPDFEGRK
jgi:hypothetical protein